MEVLIYHNPLCSKSRKTLSLIRERDIDPDIVYYLDSPPDRQQLEKLIDMLHISPRDLVRKGEAEYQKLGLESKDVSDSDLVDAMLAHPILIERPIVVSGKQARIGRPPESVLEIL